MTEKQQYDMAALIEKVPMCGCGPREELWGVVGDALMLLEKGGLSVFPADAFPVPYNWVTYVIMTLDHAGFAEHGGSIYGATLTKKGRVLLSFLRTYGCDEDQWPGGIGRGVVGDMTYTGNPEEAGNE